MADTPQFQWPHNSWAILTKIIRAWYTAESGGNEVTQKKIADVAGVQQSQVSSNKAFLQMVGIVSPEGLSLTEAGKRLGIGIYSDNESMRRQGLELIIARYPLLRDMLDIIKGRGSLKLKDFSDEIALRANGKAERFATGVAILQEVLTGSGLAELTGDTLRPVKGRAQEEPPPQNNDKGKTQFPEKPSETGLKRIPIAVSTNAVWWIEVGDSPKPEEVQKFLEMQKLMFG
jgi:hypothetical protein